MATNNTNNPGLPFVPPQMLQNIQQYQNAIEMCSRNILATRQSLERPDLSAEDKDRLRKQEQALQQQLHLYQTLLNAAPAMQPQQQPQPRPFDPTTSMAMNAMAQFRTFPLFRLAIG